MNERILGKEVKRVDARDKVTGRLKYAGDLRVPNLHYGKVLFSAYPRAKVLSIKTDKAAALPGVKKVITYKDVKGPNKWGYTNKDRFLLVPEGELTRYVGDSIAFVVAETEKVAQEALKLIEVEYEPLKAIGTTEEAADPGAPLIHDYASGNICVVREAVHGDVESAFTQCDYIVEEDVDIPRIEHAFIETESGIAYVDGLEGILHVYSCLQDPYYPAWDISHALGIPQGKVHVKATLLGGGFGGKLDTTIQAFLAAMTYYSGVPVKLVLTREESIRFHNKRHPAKIHVKVGATKDGKILAMHGRIITDAGPYHDRTAEVLGLMVHALSGAYHIPNLDLKGTAYYTNNLCCGAFRGFGDPQGALGRELTLNSLARTMGMDPQELRAKNFLHDENVIFEDRPVRLEQIKEKMDSYLGGPLPAPSGPNKVVGRGFSFDKPIFDISSTPSLGKSGVGAAVEMFQDGSVIVHSGITEMGQGYKTIISQIVAEELGVDIEEIQVDLGDNISAPRAGRTSASRGSFVGGNSVILATQKIKETLLKRAAIELDCNKDAVELGYKKIYLKDMPERSVPTKDIAMKCFQEGIKLREESWFKHHKPFVSGHTYTCAGAEVEVDTVTGEVTVLKLANIHDAGKVLNPQTARGQMYGAALQSFGYALMENIPCEEGFPKARSFSEYKIPTALDVPSLAIADFIENPYPLGPYGAKGMGEHGINGSTPAIVTAIGNAIGKKFNKLPVLQEDIVNAIKG